jgi:hypothetical protein
MGRHRNYQCLDLLVAPSKTTANSASVWVTGYTTWSKHDNCSSESRGGSTEVQQWQHWTWTGFVAELPLVSLVFGINLRLEGDSSRPKEAEIGPLSRPRQQHDMNSRMQNWGDIVDEIVERVRCEGGTFCSVGEEELCSGDFCSRVMFFSAETKSSSSEQ